VAEQNLDDPDVGSVLQQMRREAVAQRNVCKVTRFVSPAALTADRQAACSKVGSIE
jgi:hypothetical protein